MSISEKLTTIAENEQKVYEAGKKAEYDKFWDAFQDNGNRTNYTYIFYGGGFDINNFYPKYDIKPEGDATRMFCAWEKEEHKFSLAERLRECGVVLDTSKATNLCNAFSYTRFTEFPTIDLSSLGTSGYQSYYSIFGNNWQVKKIEKIIMNENTPIYAWFSNCVGLEHLVIEGAIGQNGFNISYSKNLTKESILSILKALYLGITETKTITFSTVHQTIIETDADCKPYWEAAKAAGWSFVYA